MTVNFDRIQLLFRLGQKRTNLLVDEAFLSTMRCAAEPSDSEEILVVLAPLRQDIKRGNIRALHNTKDLIPGV